jgi:L-fuculose-phosphate aldolase
MREEMVVQLTPPGQTETDVPAALAAFGRRVMQSGLSAGTGGNISARDGDIVWMKAGGLAMDELTPANLCGIDAATGRQVRGELTPTSELNMHLAVYRARADVQAVFHVHPPCLSGVVSAGIQYRHLVSESVFYLGRVVTIPYVTPTTRALAEAVAAAVVEGDTLLMPNHGLLATGATMREAFHRCMVAEDAAQALVAARIVGTPRFLTDEEVRAIRALGA